MLPIADHLGLIPDELQAWRTAFASTGKKVLLVEGKIDVTYLNDVRKRFPAILSLPNDVSIVDYGGKNALSNTRMLQFVLNSMERVFVTFDLDAKAEIAKHLIAIGLEESRDFAAVGIEQPGKRRIEGLLPGKILDRVHSANSNLINELQEPATMKDARTKLKSLYLQEFTAATDVTEDDLKAFRPLGRLLAAKFK